MRSIRNLRVGLLASLAALCALALTAGPASAWNTESGGLKLSGTITLKTGAESTSCTFPSSQDGIVYNGDEFEASTPTTPPFNIPYAMALTCTGGTTFEWNPYGEVGKTSATVSNKEGYTGKGPSGTLRVPLSGGWWFPGLFSAPWTNASGGTPSHITLSSTVIGTTQAFQNISATGTINFTTLSGGALTTP